MQEIKLKKYQIYLSIFTFYLVFNSLIWRQAYSPKIVPFKHMCLQVRTMLFNTKMHSRHLHHTKEFVRNAKLFCLSLSNIPLCK